VAGLHEGRVDGGGTVLYVTVANRAPIELVYDVHLLMQEPLVFGHCKREDGGGG